MSHCIGRSSASRVVPSLRLVCTPCGRGEEWGKYYVSLDLHHHVSFVLLHTRSSDHEYHYVSLVGSPSPPHSLDWATTLVGPPPMLRADVSHRVQRSWPGQRPALSAMWLRRRGVSRGSAHLGSQCVAAESTSERFLTQSARVWASRPCTSPLPLRPGHKQRTSQQHPCVLGDTKRAMVCAPPDARHCRRAPLHTRVPTARARATCRIAK